MLSPILGHAGGCKADVWTREWGILSSAHRKLTRKPTAGGGQISDQILMSSQED